MPDSADVHEYFECRCTHSAHFLTVTHWKEEDLTYISFFLNPNKGFFGRLRVAFLYLFKIGELEPSFNDFEVKPKDKKRLAQSILGENTN